MSGDDLLNLLVVVIFFGGLLALILTRLRSVKQGHVALVQTFGRHSAYWTPGLHFLWPFQTIERELFVQKREMDDLPISAIFTHGGLPLTVMLAYEMGLDPENMPEDDLYKDDEEREDQQIRIFKGVLQRLVREASPPSNNNPDPNRVNTLLLFSPFLGQQVAQIRDELESQAAQELAAHGIRLSPGSLILSRFILPPEVVEAYSVFLARGFTSASWHEFITRLRNAGINLSDAAAVQLMHVMQENPGTLNTIFTSGGFQPDMRIQVGEGMSMRPGQISAPPPSAGDAQPVSTPAAQPPGIDRSQDLPLTEEDMLLLR